MNPWTTLTRFSEAADKMVRRIAPVSELFVAAAGCLLVYDAVGTSSAPVRIVGGIVGLGMIIAGASRCIADLGNGRPKRLPHNDPH